MEYVYIYVDEPHFFTKQTETEMKVLVVPIRDLVENIKFSQ